LLSKYDEEIDGENRQTFSLGMQLNCSFLLVSIFTLCQIIAVKIVFLLGRGGRVNLTREQELQNVSAKNIQDWFTSIYK
jgi:hypothetical protein